MNGGVQFGDPDLAPEHRQRHVAHRDLADAAFVCSLVGMAVNDQIRPVLKQGPRHPVAAEEREDLRRLAFDRRPKRGIVKDDEPDLAGRHFTQTGLQGGNLAGGLLVDGA